MLNRLEFPFVDQGPFLDCGAACLSMIAQHFGKNYFLDFVKRKLVYSEFGVSLSELQTASKNLGFNTIIVKTTLQRIIDTEPFPCILHWAQDHFVVLYDIEKPSLNKEFIFKVADPRLGLVNHSIDIIYEGWLLPDENMGVAMLFEEINESKDARL